MAVKDSKYNEKGSDSDVVVTTTETNYYDPSLESKWTRMGLTKESFKVRSRVSTASLDLL